MFIQTEATPNPASMKFLPGRTVLEAGTLDLRDAASAAQSPLAAKLFAIPNVAGVFFGQDFIAVTKSDGNWNHLKPAILGAVMEHYLSGDPIVRAGADLTAAGGGADEFFDAKDAPMVAQIKELIETRVRPAVAQDGGDIVFHDFTDGVVYLHMQGSCAGCPSSTATLKAGIENMLRHYIPEVSAVEAV